MSKRPLPSLLLPLLVGALSLAVTAWLWNHEREAEDFRLRSAFDTGMRQAATRIEQRMASYGQMLRGAQGLLIAGNGVDQARFGSYVDTLLASGEAAGLQAIVYAPLLQAQDLAGHVEAQRRGGVPDYALRPDTQREAYAPATYIAPAIGANLKALGFDPLGDPVRSAALWRARDSGGPAITGKLRMVTETAADAQAGFLLVLPLYAAGQAIDTAAARRALLRGWVWAGFRVGDMMTSVYGEGTPGLELHLHDGVELTEESLLFRSGQMPVKAVPARFEAQEYLGFSGHSWTLHVRSLPAFEQAHSRGAAGIIAGAGVGLSVLLTLLTFQLVTGRARAQAAAQAMTRELRDSEERYRRIVETAHEGIWMTDAQGRLSFVNPMMQRLLDRPEAALLGRLLTDFVDDAAQASRLAERVHQRQAVAEQQALGFRRGDGSVVWLSMSISPISDAGGGLAGALGMVTDVTERRQAEARRSQLEAQLRESQKMEAIGTLAGGIAHDFNNILAVILGNVAAARRDSPDDSAALAGLAQIDKAAVRARSLVQQILAFSRMQPQVLLSQPLRPLVEDAVTLLRATLPAQVELVLDFSDVPMHVGADATQVQQVLMNLCTNAWHALEGRGGRITVRLDVVALDADAAHSLGKLLPGEHAHLCVSDNGCGMDEATRQRVFDPFFTTKRVGQGTGLGLSVVHGIVTAHQGGIAVESRPGQGSSFHVYLPLQQPHIAAAVDAPPRPADRAGHGEHVLYVDDDPAMLLMVEALLQRAGYRVTAIGDPRQALNRLQQGDDRFDLVVTDYSMPELTGLDLAQALVRSAPGLPVLITSGYISDDLRSAARQLGVRGLLQKEYTLEQLVGLVQAALGEAKP